MSVGSRVCRVAGGGLIWTSVFALLLAVPMIWATAGGAVAQTDGAREPDPRLDQKVTLEVGKTKLMDVAAKLTDMTGVTVKAGENDREWRVRERLVTIQARDMPLGSLLTELSRLLGFRLSRGQADGKFTYLFWQDRNAKNLEADMLNSQNAEAAERAMKMRQSTFAAAKSAASLTQAQALAQKEKSPWIAYLGGTAAGRAFCGLLDDIEANAPVERDLMLRGKRASIDLDHLSPAAGASAGEMVRSGFIASMVRKQTEGKEDPFSKMTARRISVMGSDMLGDQAAGLIGLGGIMMIMGEPNDPEEQKKIGETDFSPLGRGVPMAMMPLVQPDSMMGRAFGKMMFALDAGTSMEDANKQLMTEFSNPDVLSQWLAKPSNTETAPPENPAWGREIELPETATKLDLEAIFTGKGGGESEAFGAVSKALGIPVLAESFRNSLPLSVYLNKGKQKAHQVLVALEKAGYNWEVSRDALRVRPTDWALQRSNEIPESFLKYYKDILEKQQEFTFNQIADIAAALTDRQIQNSLMGDPELAGALATTFSNPFGGRDLLRVYASLSNAQKEALRSDAGLPFSSFDNKQWDLLSGVLADMIGGIEMADGSVRLVDTDPFKGEGGKAPPMAQIKMTQFKISVSVPGEENPREVSASVMYPTKEQIKAIRDAQKAAREAMEKAAKDREDKNKTPAAPK